MEHVKDRLTVLVVLGTIAAVAIGCTAVVCALALLGDPVPEPLDRVLTFSLGFMSSMLVDPRSAVRTTATTQEDLAP